MIPNFNSSYSAVEWFVPIMLLVTYCGGKSSIQYDQVHTPFGLTIVEFVHFKAVDRHIIISCLKLA